MAVVEALGAENIKFVGGAVRDTLIGRKVMDIDAATRHLPEKTMALLKAGNIKVIPTGLKHGTVTAVHGKDTLEITTLRLDLETDGRHAEVAFTTEWLEDAKRRDFTFNALYAAPDGALFDPFNGLGDLKAGRVVFIGDAEARIEEDALRIMRFFRFFARYGVGKPDVEAVAACGAKLDMLAGLSIERVRDELLKLLEVPDPMPALRLMDETGVLGAIVGAGATLTSCQRYIVSENGVVVNAFARFYFLLKSTMTAREIASRFKLSKKDAGRLVNMERAYSALPLVDAKTVRRAIYNWGGEATTAALMFEGETSEGELLAIAQDWKAPEFPLKGRDLIKAGFEVGPQMGETLKALEMKWIESDFTYTKSDLLSGL